MSRYAEPFIIGWEEWVSLPDLEVPAIKAKIDTGARSSALHAYEIEPFGPPTAPMVRFAIHPVPGRSDIIVKREAPLVDRREVTSSSGDKELRYFIRTAVEIGGRRWHIDVGLTNRESMTYRMLLGRQAIRSDMMVDPASSFRQRRLSYKVYGQSGRRKKPDRPALRLATLSREPDPPYNLKIAAAAEAMGHSLERLEIEGLSFGFSKGEPLLIYEGVRLEPYDVIIPRIGRNEGRTGAAFVRQFEMLGCLSLNSSDALARLSDRLSVVQTLSKASVPHGLLHERARISLTSDYDLSMPQPVHYTRVLVIGGAAMAVIQHRAGKDRKVGLRESTPLCAVAERAATALGLDIASVDFKTSAASPSVHAITPRPVLARFQKVCGVDVARAIVELAERRAARQGARTTA